VIEAGSNGKRSAVPDEFSGRVAIVTGGGSRGDGATNGAAIAATIARGGGSVVVIDIDEEAAKGTEAWLREEGLDCIGLVGDVAEPSACRAAVEETVTRLGRLDYIVNNVGVIGPPGDALSVDESQWTRAMDTNVKSMMLMAKYGIPHVTAAGGGSIVNIASVAGIRGGSGNLLYATSKGAVINMTRVMAVHHASAQIRVNAIAPGLLHTPRVVRRGTGEDRREARRLAGPLGTEGTAWDVAGAARFLLSENARWITGVVLEVDAGLSARLPLPS
jgi:NAD(P)-dependent dehydrogenase (short-subunit alcohol dehydrogenase family)